MPVTRPQLRGGNSNHRREPTLEQKFAAIVQKFSGSRDFPVLNEVFADWKRLRAAENKKTKGTKQSDG